MIKKLNILFILLLIAIPCNISAYSDYIIASGDNIGIKLNTDGIQIIGTYDIEGVDPASKAGLKIGDKIVSIDHNKVISIDNISSILSRNNKSIISIGYVRNGKEYTTELTLKNKKIRINLIFYFIFNCLSSTFFSLLFL